MFADHASPLNSDHRSPANGPLPQLGIRPSRPERLDVTAQHGAPARFISLNGPQQLGDRTDAGTAQALERHASTGTLGLEQFVTASD